MANARELRKHLLSLTTCGPIETDLEALAQVIGLGIEDTRTAVSLLMLHGEIENILSAGGKIKIMLQGP